MVHPSPSVKKFLQWAIDPIKTIKIQIGRGLDFTQNLAKSYRIINKCNISKNTHFHSIPHNKIFLEWSNYPMRTIKIGVGFYLRNWLSPKKLKKSLLPKSLKFGKKPS